MIDFEDLPLLRDPIMIAAFEGWNDAGETASATLAHLITAWNARLLCALDPELYYDFQVNRPRVTGEPGERGISWPTTKVFLAQDTPLDRDVLLVQGIEPSMRWLSFTRELVELAAEADVGMVITLGGLLADVPHTRPIPITVTSEHEDTRERYDVEPSRYEGPTGIVGVLSDAAHQAGLPTLSAWAAVPHYAGGSPSPKATLALLNRLEELLDTLIEADDLPELARAWEHGVDELAASDDEVADYVHTLEQAQDTTELPEASGDAIAREFERYLRRRDQDDE
ncbi:PAC2 family protein [Calidifontibacter sp. DB0510]|uniref:PAC2 family protein n=1 Tax=Metallococcus carri TaxID=1656884 RepID=A0A967EDK8_9MICO|nr:PAC2 family protein [Metallococcus carri]NHN54826.1 PAC2 family protein [Metallococcus carri]NOP37171.1 PAC2 family protein [Calidifontibacter sp. DB2511S]